MNLPRLWSKFSKRSIQDSLGSSSRDTAGHVPLPKRLKNSSSSWSMPEDVSLPSIRKIDDHVHEVSISKGTPSDFHEVSTSRGTPSVEIVFFHGLQFDGCTDPHITTWLSKDKSTLWLVWLLEEIPNARILLVSYDACAKQTRDQGRMDLYVIRENLLHSFTGQRANIGQYGCPVVLVGHCLGGVVMKELCIQASSILGKKRANEQDERVENLLRNVKGLFFFATPHQGSTLNFNNASPKGPLVEVFKTLNKNTARTNEEFRMVREKYEWKTFGVGESCETTLGSDFKGMIVPEASSRSYMDDFYTIPDADHLTVCQPESKQSSSFEKLVGFIGGILNQGQNRLSTKIRLSAQYVGLDVAVEKILETLRDEQRLGVVGIPGIGKSTLARVVFDTISGRFGYTCFLEEVKNSMGVGGNSKLQALILGKLCHNGYPVNKEFCWSTLKGKKVLIVLDDADNDSQVMVMIESDGFSEDSRVIVTARERQFLIQQDFFTIPVEPLKHDDSERLFCLHAFKSEVAAKGYEERVTKFATKCGGLPLALKIAGRYLYGQGKDKNERGKAEVWDGAFVKLHQAKSIDGSKQDGLWSIMKICYENLADQEQEMFLDVATCFHGVALKDVLEAWRVCSWSRESQVAGWNNLVDRGMVREDNGRIWMHEVLRDLGRSTACPNHQNVASHTRVVDVRLTKQLLNQEKALVKVLKITSAYLMCPVHMGFLVGLKELQILWFDGYSLDWPESMSDVFLPQLVFLRMKWYSQDDDDDDKLEHFLGSLSPLYQLQHLEVNGRNSLETLPATFGELSQLRHLELYSFEKLTTLPAEFGELSQLRHLEIHKCHNLTTLPTEFGKLSQLQYLELECRTLTTLPAEFGKLSQLQHLELECRTLTTLPAEFGKLSQLQHLKLKCCDNLTTLPIEFGKLSQLWHLELECCTLTTLPAEFGKLSQLQHLELRCCDNLTTLPAEFGKLSQIQHLVLECRTLIKLPTEFGKLSQLQHLDLRNCFNLATLPAEFWKLSQLQHLVLECRLTTLPAEFGNLSQLRHLELDCGNLTRLPTEFGKLSQLQHLALHCRTLMTLPVEFGKLSQLQHLALDCRHLTTLPAEFGKLSQLQHLVLRNCEILTTLPTEFGKLSQLQHLELWCCKTLATLPAEFGELYQLEHLSIRGCRWLKVLPPKFGKLSQLGHLELHECDNLTTLPTEFGKLHGLRHLEIFHCGLQELPDSFVQLEALEELKVLYCHHLRIRLSCLWDLLHLKQLEVISCKKIDGWTELRGLSSSNGTMRPLCDFTMAKLRSAKSVNCKESGVMVRTLSPDDDFIFYARHSSYSDPEHGASNSCCHIGNLATLQEQWGQVQALQSLTIQNGWLPELEVLRQFQELKIVIFEVAATFHNQCREDFKLDSCNQLPALLAMLGHLRSLKTLIIRGCCHLTELPQALEQLGPLQELQIQDCHRLRALPITLGQLEALPTKFGKLSHLKLVKCDNLTTLPVEFGKLQGLRHLEIICCGLQELPDSFVQLEALEELKIKDCYHLHIHLSCLWDLLHLKQLEIISCKEIDGWTELKDLSSSNGTISPLRDFTMEQLGWAKSVNCKESGVIVRTLSSNDDDIFYDRHSSYSDQECGAFDSYCPISNRATVPKQWGQVQALQSLTIEFGGVPEFEVLQQLPELENLVFERVVTCHPGVLEDLRLADQLTDLPRSFKTLIIKGCHNLTERPQALAQLGALQELRIEWCDGLKALPDILDQLGALQKLHIAKCPSLEALPSTLGQLGALRELFIKDCCGLKALPDTLGQLGALRELRIEGCRGLKALPDTLGQLGALQKLHIAKCPGLEALPSTSGQLGALRELFIKNCYELKTLPDTLGQLGSLQELRIEGCRKLEALSDTLGQLGALRELFIKDCYRLKALPDMLGQLGALQELRIENCHGLEALPDTLGQLGVLQKLHIAKCRGLQRKRRFK